jgi:hypothetical protein
LTLYFYSLYFWAILNRVRLFQVFPSWAWSITFFDVLKSLPFDDCTERLVRLLCRFTKSVCFSWLVFLKLQLTNKLANMEHFSWLKFKLGPEPDPLPIKFYWVLFKEIVFVKLNIFFQLMDYHISYSYICYILQNVTSFLIKLKLHNAIYLNASSTSLHTFFEFVESHLWCSGNVDSTINIQFTRDQIHFKWRDSIRKQVIDSQLSGSKIGF